MGISLDDAALMLTLDESIARARSGAPVPELWTRRVQRLGDLGIVTYIAALGSAMLAKATDPRVDVLTQDRNAGPHAYSLRKVAEFLARQNHDRFHMGATGKNPVNNRPFLGGPGRIDEFTKISPKAKPSFELFRDCLVDLNRMSGEDSEAAFVAWLRVRMEVQRVKLATDRELLETTTGLDVGDLIDTAERFVREDPEGGKRGQSFVAAALDCAFSDVVLQAINDPNSGDVRVRDRNGRTAWIVEVKQVAVDESTAFALASEAQTMGVTLALLVVLADRHSPLDREQVRRRAIREHRVLLEVAESVRELVGMVAVFSMTTIEQIAASLPGRYALRMREHGVSEAAQRRWSELMEARTN
jgi:hypothetical protein